MKLTGDSFRQLRDALLDSFNLNSLRSVVRIELEEDLDTIAEPGTLQSRVEYLIRWAERNGRVEDLLTGAQVTIPTNKKLAVVELDFKFDDTDTADHEEDAILENGKDDTLESIETSTNITDSGDFVLGDKTGGDKFAVKNIFDSNLAIGQSSLVSASESRSGPINNEDSSKQDLKPSNALIERFVHSLPLPRNLARRQTELEELRLHINDSSEKVIAVVAIGGTGKSVLVRQFLENLGNYTNEFTHVFWFSFYAEPDMDRFLAEVCNFLSPNFDEQENMTPFAKTAFIEQMLVINSCLIAIDGVEVMLEEDRSSPLFGSCKSKILRSFLQRLCGTRGKGKIILTSRWSPTDLSAIQGYQEISLPDLSINDAVDLMTRCGVKGDIQVIEAVCEHYGRHALTLAILADWLSYPPYFGDVKAVHELKQMPVETPQGIKLQSILNGYWEKLRLPERYFMTRLAAFRSGVKPQAFVVMAVNDDGIECDVNDPVFLRTLRRLKQTALLQIELQNNDTLYHLHPLIKNYFYERMTLAEKESTHLELRDYARGLPIPVRLTSWPEITPLIEIYHQCLAAGLWSEAVSLFQPGNPLGLHLYEWGYFERQIQMLEKLMEKMPKPPSSEHYPALSNIWAASGLVYRKLGKLDVADNCFRTAIEFDALTGDQAAEATHWTHRSHTFAYKGSNQVALDMIQRGIDLDLANSYYRNRPLQLGWSGAFLTALGATNAALVRVNKSIAKATSQDPPNMRHNCHSLLRRGDIRFLDYRLQQATDDYTRALKIAKTPGRKQRDFEADCLRGLADCLRVKKKFEESQDLCQSALEICLASGNKYIEIQTKIAMMRIVEFDWDRSRVDEYSREIESYFSKTIFPIETAQLHLILCRGYLQSGDNRLAGKHLREAFKLLDSSDHYWAKKELIYTLYLATPLPKEDLTHLIPRHLETDLFTETDGDLGASHAKTFKLVLLGWLNQKHTASGIFKWIKSNRWLISSSLEVPVKLIPKKQLFDFLENELPEEIRGYFEETIRQIWHVFGSSPEFVPNSQESHNKPLKFFGEILTVPPPGLSDMEFRYLLIGLVSGIESTPYDLRSWDYE